MIVNTTDVYETERDNWDIYKVYEAERGNTKTFMMCTRQKHVTGVCRRQVL